MYFNRKPAILRYREPEFSLVDQTLCCRDLFALPCLNIDNMIITRNNIERGKGWIISALRKVSQLIVSLIAATLMS